MKKGFLGILLFTVFVIVGLSSPAMASWKAFAPKLLYNGAYLTLNGVYDEGTSSLEEKSNDFERISLREHLTFNFAGYSYDPRFISFSLSLTAGLGQLYEKSVWNEGAHWSSGSEDGYNFLMWILPKHDYNLTLFASRTRPIILTETNVEPNLVEYARGALFKFVKKPHITYSAQYTKHIYESFNGTTSVDLYQTRGQYDKKFSSRSGIAFSGDYKHQSYSTPSTNGGTTETTIFANTLRYQPAVLSSSVSMLTNTQPTSLGRFEGTGRTWNEILKLELPLHFQSISSYQYHKTSNSSPGQDDITSTVKNTNFTLTHQLYQSLTSSYSFRHSDISSDYGEENVTSHNLNIGYRKIIPRGFLSAGVNYTKNSADRRGAVSIVNETHPAIQVPGVFPLGNSEIDLSTVQVFIISPVAPFESILLTENINYTLQRFGNSIQVTLLGNLPPQFILPGTFDFVVTYALTPATFKLDSDTLGFNLSVELFSLLNAYYTYTNTSSHLREGTLPEETPTESQAHTVGLSLYSGPYSANFSYSHSMWNDGSSDAWSAGLGYNKIINETTTVNAGGRYDYQTTRQGMKINSGTPVPEQSYSQTTGLIWASVTKRLWIRLFFDTSGSYNYFKLGETKSQSYELSSNLRWDWGKLKLRLGGSVSKTATEQPNRGKQDSLREHFYVSIGRELF